MLGVPEPLCECLNPLPPNVRKNPLDIHEAEMLQCVLDTLYCVEGSSCIVSINGKSSDHEVPTMKCGPVKDRVHRILYQHASGTPIPKTHRLVRTCAFKLCVLPQHMVVKRKKS